VEGGRLGIVRHPDFPHSVLHQKPESRYWIEWQPLIRWMEEGGEEEGEEEEEEAGWWSGMLSPALTLGE